MAARKQLMLRMLLVGTPRFELGASPTPRVRATRLRHVPSNLFQYGRKTSDVKSGNARLMISAGLELKRCQPHLHQADQVSREAVWRY